MKSKTFKRLVPMVLGGVAMLVLAMPMTASAHEWNHHDNARSAATWVHRDVHPDWNHREAFRPAPRPYYPQAYYAPRPAIPVYGAPAYGAPVYAAPGYAAPFGAAGCNETRLQNVYRYDKRTGHPAAANDVARRMQNCGGRVYGQNGYYGQNSVFGPLGNMFGMW